MPVRNRELTQTLGHVCRNPYNARDGYAAGERYLSDGATEPYRYRPPPRGGEARIVERLDRDGLLLYGLLPELRRRDPLFTGYPGEDSHANPETPARRRESATK